MPWLRLNGPTRTVSHAGAQMCPHGLFWVCISEISTSHKGWMQQLNANQACLQGRKNKKIGEIKVLMKMGIYFYTLHSVRKHNKSTCTHKPTAQTELAKSRPVSPFFTSPVSSQAFKCDQWESVRHQGIQCRPH